MARFLCLALVVLAACGEPPAPAPPAPPPPPPDPEQPWPSGYDPELPAEPGASLTAADAEAIVPDLLAIAAQFSPSAVVAAHDAMLAHADEICPYIYEITGADGTTQREWLSLDPAGCTSSDGTFFKGDVQTYATPGASGDGYEQASYLLSGNGQILALDGSFLRVAAYLQFDQFTSDVPIDGVCGAPPCLATSYYSAGNYEADALTAAGNPWLNGEARGLLSGYAYEDSGYRQLSYDGDFSIPADERIAAAEIDALSLDAYACPLQLTGAIGLRDHAGSWHDALFGIAGEPSCDACGELSFASEPLGEFCNDDDLYQNLLAWDPMPW